MPTDTYGQIVNSSVGRFVAQRAGLPRPVELDRHAPGDPVVRGCVLLGAAPGDARLVAPHARVLASAGAQTATSLEEPVRSAAAAARLDAAVFNPAAPGDQRFKALVFDATAIADSTALAALHAFFHPTIRRLQSSGRVIVLGTPPAQAGSPRAATAQRALEGFTRSLGKEVGRGATVQLVEVAPGAEDQLASTVRFLLSPRSAYVSGQVVRIGAHGEQKAVDITTLDDLSEPLAGKVAFVTGASRGIGEEIARVLHRDGATVVGLDVPQAADGLVKVMRELGGDWLTLDITAPDAPQRIAQHLAEKHGGVDIVVHNAGVTLDKKLANQTPERFGTVLEINLRAPERITAELLKQKVINPNGRIIGVASIAGIAGNLGQTSYAASKAGVIGFVDSLAHELPQGITINAVAPGFIITQMTAAVPFATREVGQRLNAMAQGGLPVDVAETIAWYANPASTSVNGNVVRVCGQMMLGA